MTIVLVAVCTVLTILCISLYFKVNGLKKDLDDCKNLIDLTNKIQDKSNLDISNLSRILDDVAKKVGNARLQEYANTAVSEALDGVDFDLERYDNAIKAMWQAIGTQKKRLDKIDPVKREPIDPAENLKHQSELMDKMLKQSTDIYAEKLSKKNAEKVSADNKPYVYPSTNISPEDIKDTLYSKLDSQTAVEIDLAQGGDFYRDPNSPRKITVLSPARNSGKDLYSKYMEKLNDAKDNFPASKESDTVAFPSDPEIDQYATTQIPTFANNSVEDLDETMDISEFFTRVKNN